MRTSPVVLLLHFAASTPFCRWRSDLFQARTVQIESVVLLDVPGNREHRLGLPIRGRNRSRRSSKPTGVEGNPVCR